MKSITVNYNGTQYKMEYTREAIKQFENMGFSLNDLSQKAYTARIPLVYCGLKSNHATITMKKAEEIYSTIKNRDVFVEKLVEMMVDTYTELLDANEQGNSTWEASWTDEQ